MAGRLTSVLALSAALVATGPAAGAYLPPPSGADGSEAGAAAAVWRGVRYGNRGREPGARRDEMQLMDVYAPSNYPSGVKGAVLFLHGGLWARGSRNYYRFQTREVFLARGYVFCTPEFILQSFPADPPHQGATFAEILKDVDLAAAGLSRFLGMFGIRTDRFIIAGESSGGHIALLYAYDAANPTVLGLGLRHSVPFDTVVDFAGPADLLTMDGGKPSSEMSPEDPRMIARIVVKRLCGLSDDATDEELIPLAAKWSPVNLVCRESPMTIMAYGKLAFLLPTDGLVPYSQMKRLKSKLSACGARFESNTLMYTRHDMVAADAADWACDILR